MATRGTTIRLAWEDLQQTRPARPLRRMCRSGSRLITGFDRPTVGDCPGDMCENRAARTKGPKSIVGIFPGRSHRFQGIRRDIGVSGKNDGRAQPGTSAKDRVPVGRECSNVWDTFPEYGQGPDTDIGTTSKRRAGGGHRIRGCLQSG